MTETTNKKKQELRDACLAGDLVAAKTLWDKAEPSVEDIVSWALWLWRGLSFGGSSTPQWGVAPPSPASPAKSGEKQCAVLRWLIGGLVARSPKMLLVGTPNIVDQREEWAGLIAAWSSGELEKGLAANFACAIEACASLSTLKQLCAELDPTPESLWHHATKLWHPSGALGAAEKRTLDWLLDRIAEKSLGLLCQMRSNPKHTQLITAWAHDELCEIDARFDRACAAGDVKRADALYRESFAALGLEALERNLQVHACDFAPTHPPRASAINCWLLERIAASSPKRLVILPALRPGLDQIIKGWACH
jgi:hypothetical protein